MQASNSKRTAALYMSFCALIVHLLTAAGGITALLSREEQSWQIVFVVLIPLIDMMTIIILFSGTFTNKVSRHLAVAIVIFVSLELIA